MNGQNLVVDFLKMTSHHSTKKLLLPAADRRLCHLRQTEKGPAPPLEEGVARHRRSEPSGEPSGSGGTKRLDEMQLNSAAMKERAT